MSEVSCTCGNQRVEGFTGLPAPFSGPICRCQWERANPPMRREEGEHFVCRVLRFVFRKPVGNCYCERYVR